MNKTLTTILLASLLAPAWGVETASQTLLLKPESRLRLFGDSTLHAYHSDATTMTVTIAVAEGAVAPFATSLRSLKVAVPVLGLKSGKEGLDQNLWKTLKAAEYPDITFTMSRYEAGSSTWVKVLGALTVAGRTKEVELKAALSAEGTGVRVKGRQELLMSDFGIKPPTMFLGALKTADTVAVDYDLVLTIDSRRQP